MHRYRFINSGIACDVYNPSENGSKDTCAIYLNGFPGSIGMNSIIQILLSKGYTVLQPHYPGTYDSSGEFTQISALLMIKKLREILSRGSVENIKNQRSMNIPRTITVCTGHSFGCFIALRAVKYLSELSNLILLAPAITYGTGALTCGVIEDGAAHVSYVKRSRPFTYRLGDSQAWSDLYGGKVDQAQVPTNTSLQNVIGIVGGGDKYFNVETLKRNFVPIVKSIAGSSFHIDLWIVPEGDHELTTLVSDRNKERLGLLL